jgi:pimeloyl-ACP methyl ester carboxylesterase
MQEIELDDGTVLCVDTTGDPGDPALLLLGGATSSMDWWDPVLCARLAEAGRFVVRFDARDTGGSSHWPVGQPGYTGEDLTLDPLRVLDALAVAAAHLVGVSMGGGIAQDLAVRFPDRVLSLTLVATSAALDRADPAPLPPPLPRIQRLMEEGEPELDWDDEDAVVDRMVEVHRHYAGSLGIDDTVPATARQVVRRTPDVRASVTNHWLVVGQGESSGRAMADIAAPTLVLHGTDDPLFPLPHGEALAREIPGARLVRLEGMGHEPPPRATWDVVVPAVVEHTRGADH